MQYEVPLSYNSVGAEEVEAALRVLQSGLLTQGAEVAEFERLFATRHGVRHAVMVNSGSAANLIGIEALIYLSRLRPDLLYGRMEAGDEVIIQGLNWPSTIKPLTNHGLVPVFCDVDLTSLNASVADVEAARTERTRMVIAVPVLGNPSHLDELRAYCATVGLVLFEDACESLGAVTPGGQLVGTLGHASAFSFYFSHHLTTIEGGMVLTDDPHVADLCLALRAHGWSRNLRLEDFLEIDSTDVDPRFCFVLPGYNARSTELNAAIGQVQLARLDTILVRRREVASQRLRALEGYRDRVTVPGADVGAGHSWMTFPMLYPDQATRDLARHTLEDAAVETRPIIVGNMLRHPLARNIQMSTRQAPLPQCDAVFQRGLMIGLDPGSDIQAEERIGQALIKAACG